MCRNVCWIQMEWEPCPTGTALGFGVPPMVTLKGGARHDNLSNGDNGADTDGPWRHSWCCIELNTQKAVKVVVWGIKNKKILEEKFKSRPHCHLANHYEKWGALVRLYVITVYFRQFQHWKRVGSRRFDYSLLPPGPLAFSLMNNLFELQPLGRNQCVRQTNMFS